jgi:hypothetical protein
MGKMNRPWQDVQYVLGNFGETVLRARKAYVKYIEEGINWGRREELTGGGLIRSLGGWSEVKRLKGKGKDHIMSDERILGDSDFVDSVLNQEKEGYERQYGLKRRGYDLEAIAMRVAQLCGVQEEEVFSQGRQKNKVKARSLLCYWAVNEAGISLRALAKRLGISAPAVGYAVERGEAITKENQLGFT